MSTSTKSSPGRIHETHALGQSIWYDNISRGLLRSGGLRALAEQGVTGVTSNPTIFEKAIGGGSADYEEAIRRLVADRRSAQEIYEELVLDDIRNGCDVLLPAFEQSGGVDGRISLEVLPELAANTEQTVTEGLRLAHMVGRPNVMIKVPATPEGLPAVRALTAQGVSVNITLIFSLEQYEEVAEAYQAGLEDRLAAGGSLDGLASVASFFVSRVDGVCDKQLAEKIKTGTPDEAQRAGKLVGKIAIANAKLAYEIYQRIIATPRWKALAARGAKPQRLLWASTGTKDPKYSDTLYLDGLIGPDTVNTVPPATLQAFADHGKPAVTLTEGLDEAHRQIEAFAALGLDLDAVCKGLLADGVKSFMSSMATLMGVIVARRAALLEQVTGRQTIALPADLRPAYEAEVKALADKQAPRRLWDADPALFTADTSHEKSIKSRLGWLRSPALMRGKLGELADLCDDARRAGVRDVVLLGMGGSSLCPEVLSLSFPAQPNAPALHVLDNTDPAAVRAVEEKIDLLRTLFLVASKSGGTIEIQSFERYFWQKVLTLCEGDVARAGAHFIAITDPSTKLGQLAEEKKYRRTFLNPADIGGRYSAVSYFGLVPAALLGADVAGLVDEAGEMAAASSPTVPVTDSPGFQLGAVMGALAKRGRDKLTLIISPEIESLGSWIEQLVAESTGKEGKGIVPVDGEPVGAPSSYGADRLFVYVRYGEGIAAGGNGGRGAALDAAVAALEAAGHPVVRIAVASRAALGREFVRWEIATTIAGAVLGVNPFDEPNVTEAKVATGEILTAHAKNGRLPEPEEVVRPDDEARIRQLLASVTPADYLALCAYFVRTPKRDALLARMRAAFRDRAKNATTLGFGPRFLHSTGQLHKGGANNGVFLQLTAAAPADLPIPGEAYSFATLRDAQALGDLQVLRRRGRRALRVDLGRDIDGGLEKLAKVLESSAPSRS